MLALHRAGEAGSIPNRHDRLLQRAGYWYYTTREGVDIGPFDSCEDAQVGVNEFIEFINSSEPKMVDILKQYRAA